MESKTSLEVDGLDNYPHTRRDNVPHEVNVTMDKPHSPCIFWFYKRFIFVILRFGNSVTKAFNARSIPWRASLYMVML